MCIWGFSSLGGLLFGKGFFVKRGWMWRRVHCAICVLLICVWISDWIAGDFFPKRVEERERHREGIVNRFLRIYSLVGDLWRRD